MIKAEQGEGNGYEVRFQEVGTTYKMKEGRNWKSSCDHSAVKGQKKCSPSGM